MIDKGGFFKLTVRDVPLDGKTVLVRADYNVPLEADGSIADDFRIRSSLPTLKYLIDRGCKVVIMSHLGRPDGKNDPSASLKIVADRLRELVDVPLKFADDCVGDAVHMMVRRAPRKSIILLENVRFHPEEEQNDSTFAKRLARDSGAEYFVQDGFGVVHRAHASTSAITQWLPGVAGLLIEREYMAIISAMIHPEEPFVAVLGGAKVSDKLPLIEAIIPLASKILIGGAMANTFLEARGIKVGKSKYEANMVSEVDKIYAVAKEKVGEDNLDDFIVLPKDVAVAKEVTDAALRKNVDVEGIGQDELALDIGDKTIEDFVAKIEQAKTVVWNGTLGIAELPEFSHGSARLALALATHPEITSVIGGGDTADFVLHWDSKEGGSFSHVSTGGGASLELMSGKKLPGVEALLSR
jgi:phosphoglycerate kinase